MTSTTLDALKADLRRDEGTRLKPYTDTVGKVTIGTGRNLTDRGITLTEADYLLDGDIRQVLAELEPLEWFRSLSDVRQRAIANMAFNLGTARLLGFQKMIAALAGGRFNDAAAEALKSQWATQVGQRANRIAAILKTGQAS